MGVKVQEIAEIECEVDDFVDMGSSLMVVGVVVFGVGGVVIGTAVVMAILSGGDDEVEEVVVRRSFGRIWGMGL